MGQGEIALKILSKLLLAKLVCRFQSLGCLVPKVWPIIIIILGFCQSYMPDLSFLSACQVCRVLSSSDHDDLLDYLDNVLRNGDWDSFWSSGLPSQATI